MASLKWLAAEARRKIIKDMCGRSGGDWWWEPIDPDIQKEIQDAWEGFILEALEKAVVGAKGAEDAHP